MSKICFVVATPLTLRVFLRNHILMLAKQYEITVVADFSDDDLSGDSLPGVRMISIPIARQINLFADLRALIDLTRFFCKEQFDAVHSVTPKAGLLAMIASRLTGVPHRIHCFTGQVWATRKGFSRLLLKTADRVIAVNASHILTDSLSQRAFLENERVLKQSRAVVLASGSISGVDIDRFKPDADVRARIRTVLGVPLNACVLLFVGRLNRDKGVLDLAKAFSCLTRCENVWLVVVGPDESGLGDQFDIFCGVSLSRVRRIGYTISPEHFMMAADVFVLPSYREGFGSVIIEAAACGLPAVASRIYGLTDAVEEGVSGLMHPPGDVAALCDCLQRLCENRELRLHIGNEARVRAQELFSMHVVTAALVVYYDKLLGLN